MKEKELVEWETTQKIKEWWLLNRERVRRQTKRNIQILKYQLANWDLIKKIRKKYHKKGFSIYKIGKYMKKEAEK